MNETLMSIASVSIIAIIVLALLALAFVLFSSWVMKPVNLSTQPTGHEGFDEAQRTCEALDLELGILEDLDGCPATMNDLSDKLAIARTARDIEEANLTHQRLLEEASEPVEEGAAVRQPAQRVTN